MDEKELMFTPWAAGFWECEGSCGYYTARRKRANNLISINRRLTVTISQVDRSPLDRIAESFGFGNVRKVKNISSISRTEDAYIHVWMISCKSARLFLHTIRPYVVGQVKQSQIDAALKADSNDR